MDWKQAAEATHLGIEAYRATTGRVDWETLDTLKLVSSMRTALAQLAWQEQERSQSGDRAGDLTNTKVVWSRG
jgi:hypothetical protein